MDVQDLVCVLEEQGQEGLVGLEELDLVPDFLLLWLRLRGWLLWGGHCSPCRFTHCQWALVQVVLYLPIVASVFTELV